MLTLMAETTVNTPSSGDFWNPANWVPLVKEMGIGGFFALVMFGFFMWIFWRGLTKWDKHLTRQEKLTASQLGLCRQVHATGGTANVSDFRDAGHDLVDVLQSIGEGVSEETGDRIKPKIDRIHEKLRNVPPPLPVLNLGMNGDG
jgi:hypothetical protein